MFYENNLKELLYKKALGYNFIGIKSKSKSINLDNLTKEISHCSLCDLSKTKEISSIGFGNFNSNLIFIHEQPIFIKDKHSTNQNPIWLNFSQIIKDVFGENIDNFYSTSILKCNTKKTPKIENFALCLPYIQQELAIIRPKFMVIFGEITLFRLFGFKNFQDLRGGFFKIGSHLALVTYKIEQNSKKKEAIMSDLKLLKEKYEKNFIHSITDFNNTK